MGIFIADKWADWFWSCAEGRGMEAVRSKACLSTAKVPDIQDVASFLPRTMPLSLPAHVLVPTADKRLSREDVKVHVLSSPLPKHSFCKIGESEGESLYVMSPELTFVQLAGHLCLGELIAVGYEYCGSYAIEPLTGKAVFGLDPVTTPARLRRFVNACTGLKGLQNAKRAVEFVCGNSGSPMETSLHMRYSLRPRMGGYRLPISELNHEEKLVANARRVYKRGSVRFDLFFPSAKLDVEFHGSNHESRVASDAARDAAIKMMGFDTMTVTAAQYRDYLAMGEIVRAIAKKHDMYLRKDQVGFTSARAALYRELEAYRTGRNRK